MKNQKQKYLIVIFITLTIFLMLAGCVHINDSSQESAEPYYYNFKHYVVSPSAMSFSNDVFIMNIPANVPYRIDIEQRVLDYCDWVQKASGLSFHPAGTSFDKIEISNAGGSAYGTWSGINLENMDYILDVPGAEYVYLHELTHTLQFRMAEIDCPPFTEAFAILNPAKVAESQGLHFLYWHLMHYNYSYVDEPSRESEIVSPGFEQYYRTEYDTWDVYIYGFRFGVYLEEMYGRDIFPRLVKGYAAKTENNSSTRDEFVDFLIGETSPGVFTGFVDWYWENKAVFESTPAPVINQNEIIFMPIIHEEGFFVNSDRYKLNNTITLDFADSHAYAQFKGYAVKGISGAFSFDEPATIKSYGINGTLLETKTLESGFYDGLNFANAAKLIISGYNGEIKFMPSFEKCYSK